MSKILGKNKVLNFLGPQKMAAFTKLVLKNSNPNFFLKILTCPNFLSVKASKDVKSGPKFQLEPG